MRLSLIPGIRFVDWLIEEGVVVRPEEEILEDPTCHCLDDRCFHSGVVGPLTKDQREKFCKEEEPFPPAFEERARKFFDATRSCPYKSDSIVDVLADHIGCMCRRLARQGLNLC